MANSKYREAGLLLAIFIQTTLMRDSFEAASRSKISNITYTVIASFAAI